MNWLNFIDKIKEKAKNKNIKFRNEIRSFWNLHGNKKGLYFKNTLTKK